MDNTIDPRLHHCCHNITTGSLDKVLEMFDLLKCPVVYRPNNGYRWAMVGQPQLDFSLQVSEVSGKPIDDLETKCQVHIAFISDNPREVIDQIEKWASDKGISFREGGWSEKERYFDLPELFVNFVVEVMHTSIEEE